ncbi:RNA 2',3'-cyclic phosphodiesterase [Virgibacillus doumboii]|uniref:RNA 2',3'-cyclic phosphodiesterase n=1 Tax=Virgibacillus doumboii TaxID=2697503 RepID=UPI0013DEC589|nr:RNA 2',3'-cyclic phosphodiesterase [Virgibacillus doumboii]
MTNLPHYFIAIPLTESIKNKFSNWQLGLKESLAYKQWPHKDDLHITLKFLGPVELDRINRLIKSLEVIKATPAFSVLTGNLGCFGNPKKPRVLWAGVEKTNEIMQLQQSIEQIARQAGFQEENRAYKPHITLAKKWNGTEANVPLLNERYEEQQTMTINTVVVNRIYPGSSPKYQAVAEFNLKKRGD